MVLKSWEIHSLFFQRSESVSLLRGRFNLLTYATPDEASVLQPTQYTEDWTLRHLLLSDVRENTWYSHRRLKLQATWQELQSFSHCVPSVLKNDQKMDVCCIFRGINFAVHIVQDYKGGGGWWQTRSIRCFWVIKTLIEANTTFRPKQGQRVTEGLNWGPMRSFIINEKISISSHFISLHTIAIGHMSH